MNTQAIEQARRDAEPSFVVHELFNNVDFVTSAPCSKKRHHYRSRTWIVRVVHAKSSHDDFISNLQKWYDDLNTKIRWLLMSTNKNRETTKYTQTSYVLLWFEDACREATILRNMVLAVGGLDTKLQACKEEVAQIRSDIADRYNEEECKRNLAFKRALANTVRSEISYALMTTSAFWELAEKQIVQNNDPNFTTPKCDLVLGHPRKVKFVKKRNNTSLEDTIRLCKRKRLKKIHRPKDVRERDSREKQRKIELANLVIGNTIFVQYSKKCVRRGLIVAIEIDDVQMERFYKLDYGDCDCGKRYQRLNCYSETILDVELESDSDSSDDSSNDSSEDSCEDSSDSDEFEKPRN